MFSLISDHDLLAILSRGYVYSRFISFYVLLIVGVDVRPLTLGLGPSHQYTEKGLHKAEQKL